MPELPEVEVTRRSFCHLIEAAQITSVRMGKPLRWPLGIDPLELVGRTVRSVRRRGKYLLLDLDPGLLLIHLGMSGSLKFSATTTPQLMPLNAHEHFEMRTTQGQLLLNDPRRFGTVVYAPAQDHPTAFKLLHKLGMEPLDASFDLDAFRTGLSRSRTPIKQLLLGGQVVVGVGNIYASEVLFLARIHPEQPANSVGPRKVRSLFDAIRTILSQAVEAGGTTLRDFSANGMPGHFQQQTKVYDRAGMPCTHCGHPIKQIKQGQRSTFFCPNCQKISK